ncbi:acyl-CoA thioesterase [Ichthyenterobacterium sp. W332]|uniref:Acyl-CoA thioesterase n=1 Tax=Microcosmobacter mediterraneus TaxID=3075607 RepID=A0ABU2YMP6_9FLAO|nr:acyl-CoA thioesterase [Ichthyenterobacterium sp. W332]MDT0559433.1 acyl-CoA thioesterase [Ichthyenterobacterium sp. W332]
MNNLPKILESNATIRFQDCDPFNHLNNASYINYFMNHREDMLITAYNIDIYKMARKDGKSWVVGTNQIAYLRPALLMEEVILQSQLLHYTQSELFVEMRMYNNDKSHLKAILWSSFVHFNLINQQRETHTNDFIKLFESVKNPLDTLSFENRIKSIKTPKPKV